MKRHAPRFHIVRMCRALRVSRSGYYGWLRRPESQRCREDRRLRVEIRAAFRASRGTYGSPRLQAELRSLGWSCGKKRIVRLMQQEGLVARKRRRYRVTTNSAHDHPIAPNRLARRFQVSSPDRVWLSDLTYLSTRQGWLYVAAILDLCSRRIVGWATSHRLTLELTLRALEHALIQRCPREGLLHHSDRGSQYTAAQYRQRLHQQGIQLSMSRRGECYDNAPMESFFSTLKTELPGWGRLENRRQAQQVLFDYIERFYNRTRRHSALGYLSPAEFERQHAGERSNLELSKPGRTRCWQQLALSENVP